STDTPIKTLSNSTKDFSRAAVFWMVVWGVAAIALVILNFALPDQYKSAGSLGKIGIPQDAMALFVGTVFGGLLTQGMCYYKENQKKKIRRGKDERVKTKPTIKFLRATQAALVALPIIFICGIAAIKTTPNGVPDFFKTFSVGGLHGSTLLMAREA